MTFITVGNQMFEMSGMSDSPLSEDTSHNEGEPPARNRAMVPARAATAALKDPIQFVSFWTAAVLPLVYLPLLAYGIESRLHAAIFLGLVVANVVALVVGRSYLAE